jgi:hypothetical protein
MCQSETAHLATLKFNNTSVYNLQTPQRLNSKVAEKSSWNQANRGENLVWFPEIERKLAKLSMSNYLYLPFFLLIIS